MSEGKRDQHCTLSHGHKRGLSLFTYIRNIVPYMFPNQGMSFNISVSVLGRLGHINPLRSSKIPLNGYFKKRISCVIKRFVYISVQAATAGAAAKSGGGETSERRQEEEGPAGGDSRGENQTQTSTNKTPRRTL